MLIDTQDVNNFTESISRGAFLAAFLSWQDRISGIECNTVTNIIIHVFALYNDFAQFVFSFAHVSV